MKKREERATLKNAILSGIRQPNMVIYNLILFY